ncbi:class II fructose-bisphosphate aldolase [Dehalococcoidia bacterium]|nr:class II fructose-bisphosphate aldolase [Dehalococcoidia bacterium]
MLVGTQEILDQAVEGGFAVGAFNVYNLEGAKAVVQGAEQELLPVIIQIHPTSILTGSKTLSALCLEAAKEATVLVSVHLDHSDSEDAIKASLIAGIRSVMADGSSLKFDRNVIFTRQCVKNVHSLGGFVEGELGRLSGTEDGLTIPEYEARYTNPEQAYEFCIETGLDALAICIGNVHGKYFREPELDFGRLSLIKEAVSVPLVLHGGSGLSESMVRRSIELGVRKLNVNTELRNAYLGSLRDSLSLNTSDITNVMDNAVEAMTSVVVKKIRQFAGK